MAVQDVKTLVETVTPVKFGSADHKTLIETGYGMSFKKAETIIKERKADPASWPYEMLEKAEAMMAAAAARNPKPTATRQGWKRTQVS